MSSKVKGITIELNADASGLESALRKTNKELAGTQQKLAQVNKALQLDPGNVDLLNEKYRLLQQSIDGATDKLNAMKEAQASMQDSGSGSPMQMATLNGEINDTTQSITDLKDEQAGMISSMLQARGQATAFGSAMTNVANGANAVAEATKGISAGATMAVSGLLAMSMQAAQSANDLIQMSNQTGLTTDTLQKLKYASSQINVPLDTITSSIDAMRQKLTQSDSAWKRIGVNVKDQNGELKSTEQIFNQTIKALGNIENETKRDAAAMEIFGSHAKDLKGLIDDGGKAFRQLGEEADKMGVIMSEDDLQKLAEFQQALDGVKMKLSMAFSGVALNVLTAMAPVIDEVVSALNIFAQILANIPAPITQFATVALLLLAALSPAASIIGSVANALTMLSGIIPMVGSAIGQMVTAATAAIAGNPYTGVILAIIAALAMLAAAIYLVVTHLEDIKSFGATAFDGIKNGAQKVLKPVEEIKDKFASAFGAIPGIVNKAVSSFTSLVNGAKQMVSKVANVFAELQQKAFNLGHEMMSAFTSGINSAIDSVINSLQSLASTVSSILNGTAFNASQAGSAAGSAYAASFESSTSQISTPRVSAVRNTSSSASAIGTAVADALTSASPTTATTATASGTPVQVTVELVGSAKNIFETVRVENNTLATATGYHALA